jgi:hypothetical protein
MPLKETEQRRRLASWLRSPWFAVAIAFVLRTVILRIYHHYHDAGIVRLPTIGTESGKVAWSIAMGKGFSGLWYGLDGPTAWISPVYPYLLAAVYKLAHMDNYAARVGAQIMNCAFASLTCWPIYAVGRKIFSVRTGLLAAWAWVVLPTAIQIPMEWIWDQSLDALLVALLLWATLELRENSSTANWSAYGLSWAFAVLTNPGLGVMLPFFVGWLVVQRKRSELESGHLVERTALFFILAMVPWTLRNYKEMGAFIPVKSNFGLELWLGNNPAVKHVWSPELHPWASPEGLLPLLENGEIRYNKMKQAEAMAFIGAHPGTFLRLTSERILDTWTSWYEADGEVWLKALGLSRAFVIFYAGFSLLAFVGLFLAMRSHIAGSALLLYSLALFPLVYYITHSNAHYRHAIDPALTILSAYALSQFRRDVNAAT